MCVAFFALCMLETVEEQNHRLENSWVTLWFSQEFVDICPLFMALWVILVFSSWPLPFILWLDGFHCRNSSIRSQMIEEEEMANEIEIECPPPQKWEENTEVSQKTREGSV